MSSNVFNNAVSDCYAGCLRGPACRSICVAPNCFSGIVPVIFMITGIIISSSSISINNSGAVCYTPSMNRWVSGTSRDIVGFFGQNFHCFD